MFESSYNQHINRKSVKITYICRNCNETKTFYNRCNLLSHIRSHTFKTATINVSDLKIDPLPMSHFKSPESDKQGSSSKASVENQKKTPISWVCFDCKAELTTSGAIYKERAKHYMQFTNEVKLCPVCLFALPTVCALKAHLRLHTNSPPFYCPECGQHLSTNSIKYPFTHHCEGFYMMRATTRLECPVPDCNFFHPNDAEEHFRKHHLNKVYKCQVCVVACFNAQNMHKHLQTHGKGCEALIYYQCALCPGRLIGQINNHIKTHTFENIYPCWQCGSTYKDINTFIKHHIEKHSDNEDIRNVYMSAIKVSETPATKRIYRVIKRCEQCKRSFAYRCKYDEIQILPNECPYKCTMAPKQNEISTKAPAIENKKIICSLCQTSITQDWEIIKEHYAEYHKSHRCLDLSVRLKRISAQRLKKLQHINNKQVLKKTRSRRIRTKISKQTNLSKVLTYPKTKIGNEFQCSNCNFVGENKQLLESHILTHRDPFMAYQCMECGQSFVVKPSFSKHLLLEHNIDNVEEYITEKNCYNENALEIYRNNETESNKPVLENQCSICREQFDNPDDLDKHFRMHGMAFLMKNASTKTSSK